jgi:membrane protease YdiL (CAAX protease family)
MSASVITRPTPTAAGHPAAPFDRSRIPQYSLAKILGVWAAAAVPMGVLAWVVAPLLSDQLGGRDPFAEALLTCLTAGLIWQFALTLILVRRELGTLQWSRVREALWLQPPQDPKTKRVGGRVWWWALLFVVLVSIWQLAAGGVIPGPSVRDLGDFLGSDRAEHFFSGAWGWFAVVVALAVFNTVLGEELLFRGLLLPRMRGVFGRGDWVANGALFTLYHLHMPWVMPTTLVEGIFLEAYPSRRFQSAWMGIIVHSAQSVFVIAVVLGLVL